MEYYRYNSDEYVVEKTSWRLFRCRFPRYDTLAFLLLHAGYVSQWAFDYRFYQSRGLSLRDVSLVVAVQQAALVLGRVLPLARLPCPSSRLFCMRVPRGLPPFSPLALVAATVAKARGHFYGAAAIQGFLVTVIAEVVCPSDDVGISAWQGCASHAIWTLVALQVDVLRFDIGTVYQTAAACYAAAVVCLLLVGRSGRRRCCSSFAKRAFEKRQTTESSDEEDDDSDSSSSFRHESPSPRFYGQSLNARLVWLTFYSESTSRVAMSVSSVSIQTTAILARVAFPAVVEIPCFQYVSSLPVLLVARLLAHQQGTGHVRLLASVRGLPQPVAVRVQFLRGARTDQARRVRLARCAAAGRALGTLPGLAALSETFPQDVCLASQAYVTFTSWVATCLLVEVCGLRKEWIIGMAAALYLSAAVTVWLDRSPKLAARAAEPAAEIDGPVEEDPCVWQRGKLDGPLASPEGWLDAALCRTTALLEDMAALTLRAAQFLLEAVAVLNRDVFELNGDYPFTRVMNSFPSVLIFRKCCESISSCVANISSDDVTTKMKLTAAGSVICIAGLSASFHYAELSGPDYGTEHALVALGTTMATERSALTPLWHCRTMAGLLATAILLWPCDVPDEEFAVKKVWMSDLVCVAFSLVVTGALLAYWWPVRRARIEHAPLYSNC
ncbi:uncharacterized protein [Dermacentor albipictus]|uniref:uncharacterized protein isoform X2 n=1 Tax=Dermacentor albipictus TaxID=60249 RepID=UPI0031FE2468